MLPELLSCSQFVNADEFAKALSPFEPEKASIQASRYMLMKVRYLFDRQEDFAIETTLSTKSLRKMAQEAQANGYSVTLLYFWLNTPDIAVERVKARVKTGGHNIPEPTIRRRYYAGLVYLFNDYMPLVDRWILADNSNIPFKVVAQGWKGERTVVSDGEKYRQICEIVEYAQKLIL